MYINRGYDLFLVGRENDIENIEKYFTEHETRELLSYNEKRRREFISSRYLIKKQLSKKFNLSPIEVNLTKGVFGHPMVTNLQNFSISLTHTKEFSFFTFFSNKLLVGIDLEVISEDKYEVLLYKMSESEKIKFSKNIIYASISWSVKEALSKALCIGLFPSFKVYELQEIEKEKNVFLSKFVYFPQFVGYSWKCDKYIFSLVVPKQVNIDFDAIKLYLNSIIKAGRC